jgi:hypothetical protein
MTGGRLFGTRLAHRVAWIIAHGEIPHGKLVLHKCDTPSCVNPDHLFLGTYSDNMLDMYAKGRGNNGRKHHLAKLTDSTVRKMRKRHDAGETCDVIARDFGVNISTAHRACIRKTWKHVA